VLQPAARHLEDAMITRLGATIWRRRARRFRRTRGGFTITELVVVLAMLAIVAAMGIPRMRTTRYKADAAAQLVRTLLQAAQRDAITRQSNVIVSVDTAASRLRIVQDYNNNDTLNTSDRVVYRRIEEGTHFAAPTMGRVGGVALSTAYAGSALRTVSTLPSVVFRRDGSASSDLELYLTLRTGVANEYRAVIVTPATGRVDVYRYSGTAWVRATP
jgi:prepilin-type N-terminal cleavage/methylation domain-containing protein